MRPESRISGPSIYRVALNLPRDDAPGAGLPTYMLVTQLPGRSVVTTRKRAGNFRPLPGNVTLKCYSYPEAEIGQATGVKRFFKIITKGLGFFVFFLQSVPDMIRFHPDIVHIHTPTPFLHGLFARYILRRPLCVTLHGSEVLHLQKSRFWRWVVRRADHVFFVSQQMAGLLDSFMPKDKTSYLPSGVNTGRFTPGSVQRQPVVAMVGNLRWQKDYVTALEAFARFSRDFPEWELRIAGGGTLLGELRAEAGALGIASRVNFLGVLPRDEVARLLREARVFLLSSVTEGFPKVILEAAAAGTPMVVTDVGECAAVGRQAGLVVQPKSPLGIAGALAALVSDGQRWERFSREARRVALTYTWEARKDKVLRVYQALLGTGLESGPEGSGRAQRVDDTEALGDCFVPRGAEEKTFDGGESGRVTESVLR